MIKTILFFFLLALGLGTVEWFYLQDQEIALVVETKLSMPVDLSETEKACVQDISGFPPKGKIYIYQEVVFYESVMGSCFEDLTRARENSQALNYTSGTRVRSEIAGALSVASNISLIESHSDQQSEGLLTQGVGFLTQLIKFFTFNYSFLDEPIFGIIDLSGFRLVLRSVAISSIFVITAYTYSKFGVVGGIASLAIAGGSAAVDYFRNLGG